MTPDGQNNEINKQLNTIDLYINTLEVVNLRKNLLDAVYETTQVCNG